MFDAEGLDALLGRKQRLRKADDESLKKALFGLLHEPPSLSGFNRTTWKLVDLKSTLAARGFPASDSVVREAIRKAGFRWRSAKVVLTSTDPKYREKVQHVQMVLSQLGDDERFFSIDEYGPFTIKAKPGRVLAGPGDNPSVPQWQKSKGRLIATAALELSRNRMTHFYSLAKNTAEMIRMAEILLHEYSDAKTLYLSWDAASWHMSKELLAFVEKNNAKGDGSPLIELVPLPASTQFLNVIESVFSGMARAIIHSSNYSSIEAASDAIDRYFEETQPTLCRQPETGGKQDMGKGENWSHIRSGQQLQRPSLPIARRYEAWPGRPRLPPLPQVLRPDIAAYRASAASMAASSGATDVRAVVSASKYSALADVT